MPVQEDNRIAKQVKLGERGINLWDTLDSMSDGDAVLSQNCFFRRGLFQKQGSQKISPDSVMSPADPVTGLHRFYYDTASKALLAASGTVLRYLVSGSWATIKSGLTYGRQMFGVTWGALNKSYWANGIDTAFSVDNALTAADVAAAPAKTLMFCPYRDRLLSIDLTNPSYLQWCGAAYDTATWTSTAQAIRTPGAGTNVSITLHSIDDNSNGINAMVFVAKTGSFGLFSGTDLEPTSDTFNARFDPVGGADGVGCISPRTIVSTPKGTIFLGNDKQVYILPHGTTKIVAIGHKVQSEVSYIVGINSISLARIASACAIYHDGFYKLSFPASGTSINNYQFWLDVDRMYGGDDGHYGPWYGPMTGMSISCFTKQDGAGDDGKLIGGGHANGYVYSLNDKSTFTDDGAAISMDFRSRHEAFSGEHINTRIMESEVTLKPHIHNDVCIGFNEITGPIEECVDFRPTTTGVFWGQAYWGQEYWNGYGNAAREKVEYYDKNVLGRFISTQITYSSSTDQLQVYSILHRAYPAEPITE